MLNMNIIPKYEVFDYNKFNVDLSINGSHEIYGNYVALKIYKDRFRITLENNKMYRDLLIYKRNTVNKCCKHVIDSIKYITFPVKLDITVSDNNIINLSIRKCKHEKKSVVK